MKKFIEEKHDVLAGIFAVLAVIAIVFEIVLGGFTKESFVGGVKDLSGIIIDVLVLLVAASVLIRKPINFEERFNEAMNKLKEKYSPLITEDKIDGVIRYNIASNPDSLFMGEPRNAKRLFELDENKPDNIRFYVNKSFFDENGGSDFDAKAIATEIALRLLSVPEYKEYEINTFKNNANYGIKVGFKRQLKSNDDIDSLISLIDFAILLFVARNKS